MNQSKSSSTPVKPAQSWLRILISAVLLSSLLLGQVEATPAYALDVPTQIAPADGFTTTVGDAGDPGYTPPLGIPEFKWTAVAGATSYRLQVSNNLFTTTVVDITTPNTTYTPPARINFFADGTWYWRVRVEAPVPVGEYSDIFQFTKQWAFPANAPALISPADFATIDFYDDPVFSWNPVMGAAKYKLRIYSSSGGCLAASDTITTLATTYQPLAKIPNGAYYWCVLPVDPGSHNGTPSQERSFTADYNFVPTLLAPDDNSFPTFTPTFRWTAVRGAQFYRLEYSTDSTFPPSSLTTVVVTRNTAHTPITTLPNDQDYYWRVRTHSGASISDWTPYRHFVKRWYIKPVLLTPTNNYQHQRYPLFSWTPVPGASYYFVEISITGPGFLSIYDSGTTANTFFTPSKYDGGSLTYDWRVTPYDGNAKAGKLESSSYRSYYTEVAPEQVYPLYYYPPDSYTGFPGVTTNPHEDRTAPLPIFTWHRVLVPAQAPNQGEVYADSYRLEVSTDPNFISAPNWTVDTENLVATPSQSQPFTPLPNTDYYWRVCPLVATCGTATAPWSQVWKTRIDPSRGLTATNGANPPQLIRPVDGFEYTDTTPLLEWFPLSGAAAYDVEISLDQAFSSTLDTATVPYPAYAPTQGLAERKLGALDFGTYYWRVRKSGAANPWSAVQRFQIAAESQWQLTRALGAPANQLQIGSDPDDVSDDDYELTSLQAAQSNANWYFGFHTPSSPSKNVTYALYLDLDHKTSSGATADARGYSVTTISAHRPEYAIYIFQEAGVFAADKVYIYRWNGSSWDIAFKVLSTDGGSLNQSGSYVEFSVPATAIGYNVDSTGSYSASLLSLPAGGGQPQDSVPSDPLVPGIGPVSRFSNVSARMNLLLPPNNAGVDPSTFSSIWPFLWDWPVLAPYAGSRMRAYTDPLFTSQIAEYIWTSNSPYWSVPSDAADKDFNGDNTSYYWRVQPKYKVGADYYYGAFSQGFRFERKGFVPQNLQTSVTFATPTFSWDMVEGAESYDLQVDDDQNFGSTAISINTRQNSYTDPGTLPNGTYYWRVRARRNGNVINGWSPNTTNFTLALPLPTGMNHTPPGIVTRAPTLCWAPLIKNSPSTGDPVLAAWKYRVQVSADPAFSSPIETVDTEQNCWTSTKGYADGTYYWRVAMIDGNSRLSAYTTNQTFTKQYPTTTLIGPFGATASTPTFVWTPVNGAARYQLDVSQFATFSPPYDQITTDNTRYTPVKTYTTPKTYYWRVAIIDADGKLGPFNNATIIIDPYPYRVYLPLIKR